MSRPAGDWAAGRRGAAAALALAASAWPALLVAAEPALGEASQDALRAVGPHAAHILELWRLTLAVCTVVFAAVLAALVWALWRAPRSSHRTPAEPSPPPAGERRLGRTIAAATGVSAALLFGLLVASVLTDRALAGLTSSGPGRALEIEVVSHQWWWELHYPDPDPSKQITTANELHIPVGRTIALTLKSDDVIHSLWVPNIAGKKDLIPGRTATLYVRAERPGVYRGQCAEFCGAQHAWMAFLMIAEAPEQFDAWAQAQRQSATPPDDAQRRRGEQVFLGSSCPMCHAVQGTEAGAQRAPDLTHLASRRTIAAGTLTRRDDLLAAWISDPQRFKPGSNMPGHAFSADDLQALVAYLQGLK